MPQNIARFLQRLIMCNRKEVAMKNILYLTFLISVMLGCVGQKRLQTVQDENLIIQNEEDDDEYEVIIIDSGFNTWFATNSKPMNFYSPQYYENKNKMYVTAWNDLFYQYRGNSPFENRIDYDFSIDYGVELNYKLFWYFKYVESKYGRFYNFPA